MSWMTTARSCETLIEYRLPKSGSVEIKLYQRVMPSDFGVLWVGRVGLFGRHKKEDLRGIL